MQILRRWYSGLTLAGMLVLAAGVVWAAGDPAAETQTWSALVSAMENQPALPATFQAAVEFIHQYPQSTHAAASRFLQAEILFQQGEDARALALYRNITVTAAADFGDSLLFRQGECAFNQRLWADAEKSWDRLFLQFPDSPLRADVLALRGRLLLGQDRLAEAAKIYPDLALKFPGFQTSAAFMLGITRLAISQHRETAVLKTLKHLHSPLAGYAKSRLALELHDTAQGLAILEDLWGSAPAYKIPGAGIWIRALLGQSQWAQTLALAGRLRSESDIDSGLRDDLLLVQGHCLFNLQRFGEAADAYRAWLAANPDPADPLVAGTQQRLAQAYYRLGKDALAMTAYKNYLKASARAALTPKTPVGDVLPRRFEQALQLAEKKVEESRCPRVASPWLAIVTAPPILLVQPPPAPAFVRSWAWNVYNDHGKILHQETGAASWPETFAWDGIARDGQAFLAGETLKYTLTLADAQGRSLTTVSTPKAIWAVAYPGKNTFLLSLQVSALFVNENSDRLSRFGVSALVQTADLCLRFSGPGLALDLSTPENDLGQRQAAAVVAQLQKKLEWPKDGIVVQLLPSRAPSPERLNLRWGRKAEEKGGDGNGG